MKIRTANRNARRVHTRLQPLLEERIYWEQHRMIAAECGERAAQNANYGQGVIDETAYIDVSTKIYGHGYLRTVGDRSSGRMKHTWELN